MRNLHVCAFKALPDLGNVASYRQLKALVLKAGRFSVFEATENQRIARLFETLMHDSELEVKTDPFPWSAVTRKRKNTQKK